MKVLALFAYALGSFGLACWLGHRLADRSRLYRAWERQETEAMDFEEAA